MAITFIVAAYFLGAIPFGLLLGLARGVDVRTQGSRNIGATNVGRVLGRKWGYLCLLLDIAKGLAPTLAARLFITQGPLDPREQVAVLLVAVAAVIGHVFPVYLRFRGGKGVATTIGVALGIWPYFTVAMLVALACYAIVRYATGMVSAGSLTLAVAFPLALLAHLRMLELDLAAYWPLQSVAILLGLVIIIRHRENIRRLLRGEEPALRGNPAPQADSTSDPGA